MPRKYRKRATRPMKRDTLTYARPDRRDCIRERGECRSPCTCHALHVCADSLTLDEERAYFLSTPL